MGEPTGEQDKLILLGPLFYAAPLAAFGTEHFTLTEEIASIVPAWIPWHTFWSYFVGACFIAAALSLVRQMEGHVARPSLEWLAELDKVLARRPENFNRAMTPPEKKLLEGMLERGLGVQRKKPAVKKTAPKRSIKKAAPKRTPRRDMF